jgi:hypothetical protein
LAVARSLDVSRSTIYRATINAQEPGEAARLP